MGWGLLFSALKTVVDRVRESVEFLSAVSSLKLANVGWALLKDADIESELAFILRRVGGVIKK